MVKTLRERQGLTQVQLARRAKVAQPYIAMLERGERKNPSPPVLRRIAKALGVSTHELVRGGRVDQAIELLRARLCEEAERQGKNTGVPEEAVRRELRIPAEVWAEAIGVLRTAGWDLLIAFAVDGEGRRWLKLGRSWLTHCEDRLGRSIAD